MKVKSESEVAQSCPALCDPMDCSQPGSSLHGIFQVRILEWGAISFSRGSSRPRLLFVIANTQSANLLCPWNSPGKILEWVSIPFSRGSSQPRIKPGSPALQVDSSPSELPWKPSKGTPENKFYPNSICQSSPTKLG